MKKIVMAFLFMASTSLVGAQTLQTICSFNSTNGVYPFANLTLGNDGIFYGTTRQGGIGINNSTFNFGWGTIFRITTNGSLTTLVYFDNNNGSYSCSGLTLGTDGNFYGTTGYGGNTNLYGGEGCGTVFRVTTNGSLTTLYSFTGEADGANPLAALTLGNDGNFYGTTSNGGNTNLNNGYGYGTVFKVTTNGTLTTLVCSANNRGANPCSLTFGNDGNFYGTTLGGGITNSTYPDGMGTVFSLSLSPIIPPTMTLQFWAGYPLLSLYGTLGDTYMVQYATNLAAPNWTLMLIVPNLSLSPFQMIDPAGIGQPARFYRAVMQ